MTGEGKAVEDEARPAVPAAVATAASSSVVSVTLSLGGRSRGATETAPLPPTRALVVPAPAEPPANRRVARATASLDSALTSAELSTPPAAVRTVPPDDAPRGPRWTWSWERVSPRVAWSVVGVVAAVGVLATSSSLLTLPRGLRPLSNSVRATMPVEPLGSGALASLALPRAGASAASSVAALARPMMVPEARVVAPAVTEVVAPVPSSVAPAAAVAAVASAAVASAASAAPVEAGEPTDWIDPGVAPRAATNAANAAGPAASRGARTSSVPLGPAGAVDANAPRVTRAGRVQGYVEGRPINIEVTMVDGKPVEVHTAASLERMRAAALRDGVRIEVRSGFRTMEHQELLYRAYRTGRGNLAALPGHSNHQSGHAVDLNTATPGVLRWLNGHARSFGFRRTVPTEPWHWEYWP